ncbi:MAG: hypothetical protein H6Q14_2185 [Bacteroidetes bacterium]|nr:hypothetical protein [Bacteroidota bacterium]
MNNLLLTLFLLLFSLSCYCQTFDREIVKKVEYYQIKGDKVTETDTLVIQINNRQGEEDICIGYTKGDKLSIDGAWIEDMEGNVVRKLSMKDIKDRNYNSESVFFGDYFIKYFSLKHHAYPYKIIYCYRISYSKSFGACRVDCRVEDKPVHSGILVVELPWDETIKHKEVNVKSPEIVSDGIFQKYTWRYSYTPLDNKELNQQKTIGDEPIVRVLPTKFKYGVAGSFDSWQSYGNWVYRLNKGRDELPLAEQSKITSLINGVPDAKTKAKILYRYLQDYTRYINVSLKLGGFQSYPASYVSENKYGDCKALTYFMQAMLKHAGITSFPTLVLAGEDLPKTDTSFPFPEFNHVILCIPFEKDTVFLECTAKNIPFGYLGTFTQDRPVLIVEENSSHITHTPALKEKDVRCSTTFNVNPEQSEVTFKSMLRGKKYEYFNSMESYISRNQMDIYIRNGVMPSSSELLEYSILKNDRNIAEIRFNAKVRVENIFQAYGKNLRIKPFPISLPLYETPGKRKSGLQFDYPECYSDTIVYHLGNQSIPKAPSNVSIQSKYGSYSISYTIGQNTLTCTKALSIPSGKVDLKDYKSFYEFIQSIRNIEYRTIYTEIL